MAFLVVWECFLQKLRLHQIPLYFAVLLLSLQRHTHPSLCPRTTHRGWELPSPRSVHQSSLSAGPIPETLLSSITLLQLVRLVGTALRPQPTEKHDGHSFLGPCRTIRHRETAGMTVWRRRHGIGDATGLGLIGAGHIGTGQRLVRVARASL